MNAVVIRSRRSATYVDATNCDRPSSVVCLSVAVVRPAKTAELIEMSFLLRIWLGPRNYVLDGGPDPPMGRDKFNWEMGRPILKYSDSVL